MIQATEQQLQLIAAKASKLESTLQAQISDVKQLKQERADAWARVEQLRELLAGAEDKAQGITERHEKAASALREAAGEYARAQLLQKKYQNTLLELRGHCRAVVALQGLAGPPRNGGGRGGGNQYDDNRFAVVDECTINAAQQRKSFVVDGVIADAGAIASSSSVPSAAASSTTPAAAAEAIGVGPMVAECLSGHNVGAFTFGPAGSGKSALMFGCGVANIAGVGGTSSSSSVASSSARAEMPVAPVAPTFFPHPGGLAAAFLRALFSTMEEHEVTHFNMRCSFAELEQDRIVDLLSEFGNLVSFGGAPSDVRALPVHSLGDALQLLKLGLDRTAARHSRRRAFSHLIFSVSIENFNLRGHFRRATVMFADLCGVGVGGGVGDGVATAAAASGGGDALWVAQSINALCDVITARATNTSNSLRGPEDPMQLLPSATRSHVLVRMLSEMLAGNCRTTMLCCVNVARNSDDEVLAALSYATQFKKVQNNCVPYDIPPELQRLHMEMSTFAGQHDVRAEM